MIFVDRKLVAAPQVLTDDKSKGKKELAKALAFYKREMTRYMRVLKKKAPPTKSGKKKPSAPRPQNFKFDAYREDEVKKQLAELFHKKCAYCEFNYAPGISGDVEHYRPKGGVKPDQGKPIWPGYYWLALDWENLLPSCTICNQSNTQLDLTTGDERTVGKLNSFPLVDEKHRAKPEGDISKEDPLLLNPCADEPQQHLQFVERDGHRALLHGLSDKGAKTIELLGLNRADLVKARWERLIEMEILMKDIQRAYERLNRAANPADRQSFLDEIEEKKARLQGFMKPESEFSALALQEVPKFLTAIQKSAPSGAS